MKRIISVTTLLVIVLVILVWLFRKPVAIQPPSGQEQVVQTNIPSLTKDVPDQPASSKPTPSDIVLEGQAHMERIKRESEIEIAKWKSPIIYYGKVVDENGNPIQGAIAAYNASALDGTYKQTQITGSVTSDERGIFKIDGINGYSLMLEVSHPNYYSYPDNSTGFSKGSLPRKGYFSDTEQNAELFRMHSKGHPLPLVHRADGMNVPLDGVSKALDLRGGDYNQKTGRLVVEATGTPPPHYNQQPFDWDAKITVPGGGLIEYTNQFEFVAPDSGYQTSVEFSFPKDRLGWTDTVSKNYFLKLPSGYARLNIYIGAKRPLFFSVEYDYNPDGSPNLERAR